ncbi:MAG: glycosyltransferase family 2 protein [Lachnospiraceae bacterium]|nr:glycosyltransferase family 2 protein [Lachnospiraceae bacterium]
MKEYVKVSVIIAIYNAEKYLSECLDSVLNQTLREIEVICVNDGSTDSSLEILKKYEAQDNRVKILDQKNQGAGAARNNGLQVAKGEYLSFLDSDDFFEPDMLEVAYRIASVERADICVFAANLFVQSTSRFEPCQWSFRKQYFPLEKAFDPHEEQYRDNIFRMYNGWAWDKLFKREFVEQTGLKYQNLRTTNDMFFVFIGLAKASRIVALDRVFAHQRIEISTSLSSTREKSWDCFYVALLAMQQELKDVGLYEIYKKAYVNWALEFSLWQLNTMKGLAHERTYELLRTSGFAKLDIAKYPRSYFFSEEQYKQFLIILSNPRGTVDE